MVEEMISLSDQPPGSTMIVKMFNTQTLWKTKDSSHGSAHVWTVWSHAAVIQEYSKLCLD